jgi:hypothetical protein
MHPSLRIAALLVLAAGLPQLSLAAVALVLAALLAAAPLSGGPAALVELLAGMARLRWLLLALLVLHLGFTVGEPVHEALPGVSREGLAEGTRRAIVLLDLLAAVHVLLRPLGAARTAAGLLTLLAPLRRLGLPAERLGLRLGLVLEAAPAYLALPRHGKLLDLVAQWALAIERDARGRPT